MKSDNRRSLSNFSYLNNGNNTSISVSPLNAAKNNVKLSKYGMEISFAAFFKWRTAGCLGTINGSNSGTNLYINEIKADLVGISNLEVSTAFIHSISSGVGLTITLSRNKSRKPRSAYLYSLSTETTSTISYF